MTGWIRDKAVGILPDSMTRRNESARDEAERREPLDRMQGEAARDLSAQPSNDKSASIDSVGAPVSAAPLSLSAALADVGTHVGESVSHALQPVIQPVIQKIHKWQDGNTSRSSTNANDTTSQSPATRTVQAGTEVSDEPAAASLEAQERIDGMTTQEKERKIHNL